MEGMNLLQMSVSAGLMILAALPLRALLLGRLPKRTFVAIWGVVALRLLLPFSIPFHGSAYTAVEQARQAAGLQAPLVSQLLPGSPAQRFTAAPVWTPAQSGGPSVWTVLWLAGAALCAGYYLFVYLRCRREFQTSLPFHSAYADAWLRANPLAGPYRSGSRAGSARRLPTGCCGR